MGCEVKGRCLLRMGLLPAIELAVQLDAVVNGLRDVLHVVG